MNFNIIFNNHNYERRIADVVKVRYSHIDTSIVRIDDEGQLLGGVLYTDFTGRRGSLQMHCAGFAPRWLNRDLLWVAFHYPFVQLGVNKIFLPVPVCNAPSLRFTENLGFVCEHVIKDAYPDGDMCLMSMYRSSCRFLGLTPRTMQVPPDGQVEPLASAAA